MVEPSILLLSTFTFRSSAACPLAIQWKFRFRRTGKTLNLSFAMLRRNDGRARIFQKTVAQGRSNKALTYGGVDDIGRPIGIQCKRFRGPLKLSQIEAEVEKAEAFDGRLSVLYMATTTDYDARLQAQVRQLSDRRVARGQFAVTVLFWDHIVGGLMLNPAVIRAHYPHIILPNNSVIDNERMLAALELGYFGSQLWAYIVLIFGEFGEIAQADPDELIADLRIVERRTQQLLEPDDAAPILEAVGKVRSGCLAPKTAKSDWDPVEAYANRVKSRLKAAMSLLPMSESNALSLGFQLARYYYHLDDVPSIRDQNNVQEKVRSVLPATSAHRIERKFLEAKKLQAAPLWVSRIFGLLSHEFRYRAVS